MTTLDTIAICIGFVAAFLLGCYVGGQLVAWHIKSEFKKIDEQAITSGEKIEKALDIYR